MKKEQRKNLSASEAQKPETSARSTTKPPLRLFWVRVLVLPLLVGVVAFMVWWNINGQIFLYRSFVRRGVKAYRKHDYPTAESELRKAYFIALKLFERRRQSAWEDKYFMAGLTTFAASLLEQGKYPQVEVIFRRSLPRMIADIGQDNPRLVSYYRQLVESLVGQHKYGDAEIFTKEMVRITNKAFGPKDPQTLAAQRLNERLIPYLRGEAAGTEAPAPDATEGAQAK